MRVIDFALGLLTLAAARPQESPRRCQWCGDRGLVLVATRPVHPTRLSPRAKGEVEEYGPCPHCDHGKRIEFPPDGEPGPWGKDGYWRSRSDYQIRPGDDDARPLSREENRRRRELLLLILEHGATPELLDELYQGDEWGRKEHDRLIAESLHEDEVGPKAHGGSPPVDAERLARAELELLEAMPRGRCDDCGDAGHERVRYGKFVLCRGCAAGRLRARIRLDAERYSALKAAGEAYFAPQEQSA